MPMVTVEWLSLRLRLRDFLADPRTFGFAKRSRGGARLGQKVRSLNVWRQALCL